MVDRSTSLGVVFALTVSALPAVAPPAKGQDPALDNLVHAKDKVTSTPGTLGAVVEPVNGHIDMVLVSGVGAPAFEEFMRRNERRYRMFVDAPGFQGTAARPMPAPGTSYGERTWTRAPADAVVLLAGSPRFEPLDASPRWPKNMTLDQKVQAVEAAPSTVERHGRLHCDPHTGEVSCAVS